MTEQFQPLPATVTWVDLGSFPKAGVAVVFGAGGGIGAALVQTIGAAEKFEHVVAFSRSTSPSIDLLDEASLERAAAFAADQGALRLLIDATGFLHDDRQGAEKNWRQLDAVNLARSFALNAIGPALIMKHVLPRLANREIAAEAFAVGFAGRELRVLLRSLSLAHRRGERGRRGEHGGNDEPFHPTPNVPVERPAFRRSQPWMAPCVVARVGQGVAAGVPQACRNM